MRLHYLNLQLSLLFERPLTLSQPLGFLLRSCLGQQLRQMTCVFPNATCDPCEIQQHCLFPRLFEAILPQDNGVLNGRNRGVQPFLFFAPQPPGSTVSQEDIQLLLIGPAMSAMPTLLSALEVAGNQGMDRRRIRFRLERVRLLGSGHILDRQAALPQPQVWQPDPDENGAEGRFQFVALSPLRLKSHGSLLRQPGPADLFLALHRRLNTLLALYGQGELPPLPTLSFEAVQADWRWQDWPHWSGRQQLAMQLGGVLGTLSFQAQLPALALQLARAGMLFHAGKNASFGLGKLQLLQPI